MWLNNIAKGLQEQVEKAGQDFGIKEHLANAQARLGTFSEDLLDVKTSPSKTLSGPSPTPEDDVAVIQHHREGEIQGWGEEVDLGDHHSAPQPMQHSSLDVQNEDTSLLREEVRELKLAAADALGEAEELKEKLEAAQKQHLASQEQIRSLQAVNDGLDARLTASEEKSFSLEQAARVAMEEAEPLRMQLKSISEASRQLQAKHKMELEEAVQKLEAEQLKIIENLRHELQEAKGVATPESKLRPVSESNGSVKSPEVLLSPTQSGDTQSEVQGMKAKLQKAKRTLDNMKKREAEAIAAKSAAEARATNLEAELTKVREAAQPDGQSGEQAELRSQCQKLQAQVVDLEHDLATVNERYETAQRQEGSQSEQLTQELNSLRGQLRSSETRSVEAQQRVKDIRLALEENQAQLRASQSFREQLETATQEKQNLELEVKQLQARIESSEHASQLASEEAMASHEVFTKAVAERDAQLADRGAEISNLQQVLESARADLEEEKTRHEATQRDLRARGTAEAQLASVRLEVASKDEAIADLKVRIENLKLECSGLEVKLKEAEDRAEVADGKAASLEVSISELQQRIDSLQAQQQPDAANGSGEQAAKAAKLPKRGRKSKQKQESLQESKQSFIANGTPSQLGTGAGDAADHDAALQEEDINGTMSNTAADIEEPSTPPAQGASLSSAELREELRVTKAELLQHRNLVTELQEKIAAMQEVPPGLSPRSLVNNPTFERLAQTEAKASTSRPGSESLEAEMLRLSAALSSSQARIEELEAELCLRSRLEDISAKVSVLESQRGIAIEQIQDSTQRSETGSSTPVDSSAGTSTSQASQSAGTVEGLKGFSKRKSRDRNGAVQQRIASLEEQLATAKQESRAARGAGSQPRSPASEEVGDLMQLKSQLQAALQRSQELEDSQKVREGEAHLAEEVAKLRKKVTEVCQERDDAQSKAAASSTGVVRLEEELRSLQSSLEMSRGEALALQENTQALQGRLEEKEAELAALGQQVQALEARCSEFQASAETASGLQDTSTTQLRQLQADLEAANLRSETLKEERQSLLDFRDSQAGLLVQKENEVEKLAGEVKELKQSIARLEAQVQILEVAGQERAEDLSERKSELKKSSEEVLYLKEQLRARENALDAVRDGSSAELKMAVAARREAESHAEKLEAAVKQLRAELSQAEERVTSALKDARENQERNQARLQEAREEVRTAEEREQKVAASLRQVQEELQKQAEASRNAVIQANKDAKKQADANMQQAIQSAREEAEQMRTELEQQCASLREQIQAGEQEVQQLQEKLSDAQGAVQALADTQAEVAQLKRDLQAAEDSRSLNVGNLEAAQKLVDQEKNAALERQKRFNLLNSQFKKKEASFVTEIGAMKTRAADSEKLVINLQAECRQHQQEVESLSERLSHAESAAASANEERDLAAKQLEQAQAELQASQTDLKGLQAKLKALEDAPSGLRQEEVDLKIQASVKEAEERCEVRMQEATEGLRLARSEAADAKERATAAELAKIQLSMRLAELDDMKAQLIKKEPELISSTMSGPEAVEESATGVVQLGGIQDTIPATTRLLDIFGCAVNNRR